MPDPETAAETMEPESATIVTPEETFEAARQEAQAQAARAQALEERAEGLEKELALALQRYRETVLRAAPELPEDLVTGETVADLDASLARARSLVERVRTHVEGGAAARVPAGAPPRRTGDLSGLSSREKIALGLEKR